MVRRRFAFLAIAIAVAVVAAGCGGSKKSAPTRDAHGCFTIPAPSPSERHAPKPTAKLDPSRHYDVVFQTNCGAFTVALDVKGSPITTASFASLVKRHFFDDTIFHRIAVGFVIQGGDPTQSGQGGPGYSTVENPPLGTTYTLGTVAMAKTGPQAPGTAGSQFFVVTTADAGLPAQYALLGHVVKGIAVVQRIGQLGDANESPTEPVVIEHATLTTS